MKINTECGIWNVKSGITETYVILAIWYEKYKLIKILSPRKTFAEGHATARAAVSCWLLTVAAWVCAQVIPVGFMVDKLALGQGFLQVLWFSPINIIPWLLHIHSCIIWWTDNGPVSGCSSNETQSHLTATITITIYLYTSLTWIQVLWADTYSRTFSFIYWLKNKQFLRSWI
jgi:hypothetical protein